MSPDQTSAGGYDEFYLRLNPADKAAYERKARGYHRRFGTLLDEARPRRVLDLGCATGMLSAYLCGRGIDEVVGVDVSAALIEEARGHGRGTFVAADAGEYLAGCDRTFDVIFALDLLEHLPRERVVEVLGGIRRCLAEGAFAIVRVPNMNAPGAIGAFHGDWTHLTAFTERSLDQVARQAGFSRVAFCNQFRMQNVKGKLRACAVAAVMPVAAWLRGGHKARVFYPTLIAQLFR